MDKENITEKDLNILKEIDRVASSLSNHITTKLDEMVNNDDYIELDPIDKLSVALTQFSRTLDAFYCLFKKRKIFDINKDFQNFKDFDESEDKYLKFYFSDLDGALDRLFVLQKQGKFKDVPVFK